MKLLQLRSRHTRPPTLAIEKTEEAAIIEREANALIAESRSRAWAFANTGLLKTVSAHLNDPEK